jgi:predicted DNA-binding transcriptional regulator YafY
MSYVKVLVQSYERDADFDAELFWYGSLGVYRAGEKEKVVLRFRDWAARVAAEREWHVSQKVRQVGGGEVEITLLVQITPDLLRWIFSWADAVEVRSPKHLRDEYRRIAQRMVEG